MVGISSKAAGGATNRFKYNGKEEQRQEFSDGSGLEWMDYGARMYDVQTGRWMTIDPISEIVMDWSPYNYTYNNPVRYIDPDGRSNLEAIENKKEENDEQVDEKKNLLSPQLRLFRVDLGDEELVREIHLLEQDIWASNENVKGDEQNPGGDDKRNPKQDKPLSAHEIEELEKRKLWNHRDKGKGGGKFDLYKDKKGNVYQKPKGNKGFGEPLGINLNELEAFSSSKGNNKPINSGSQIASATIVSTQITKSMPENKGETRTIGSSFSLLRYLSPVGVALKALANTILLNDMSSSSGTYHGMVQN